ncbi:hypothetical protein M0813_05337 [Anaeramoeba flamelloides]|uniref:Uncharacterized protein n=1 Tax=Anaeramoeba flamelloides TaxID=1746091 RepID=A0ABQ8XH64_9EUKA|nr:hypothetical protein M0813_05337 [Anaeramoeba flamelloides]
MVSCFFSQLVFIFFLFSAAYCGHGFIVQTFLNDQHFNQTIFPFTNVTGITAEGDDGSFACSDYYFGLSSYDNPKTKIKDKYSCVTKFNITSVRDKLKDLKHISLRFVVDWPSKSTLTCKTEIENPLDARQITIKLHYSVSWTFLAESYLFPINCSVTSDSIQKKGIDPNYFIIKTEKMSTNDRQVLSNYDWFWMCSLFVLPIVLLFCCGGVLFLCYRGFQIIFQKKNLRETKKNK